MAVIPKRVSLVCVWKVMFQTNVMREHTIFNKQQQKPTHLSPSLPAEKVLAELHFCQLPRDTSCCQFHPDELCVLHTHIRLKPWSNRLVQEYRRSVVVLQLHRLDLDEIVKVFI